MKLEQLLSQATSKLSGTGIVSARVDAELLLAHALNISKSDLLIEVALDSEIPEDIAGIFIEFIQRRSLREPLQHIVGVAYFRNLELSVGPGVFIPRPETEAVAEVAIEFLRAKESSIVVDLGTGSGALAISISTEVPGSEVYAVEISEAAYPYTKSNFEKYGLDLSRLLLGDLSDAFEELAGRVSVVVSNPPYIPLDMVPRDIEVRLHDPEIALYGGQDGLDVIRKVQARAKFLLEPSGLLLIEHAEIQSDAVRELLLLEGWQEVVAHKDLTGRDRSVSAKRA